MIFQKDWKFSSDEYLCDLRTVGVCIKENKILVQCDREGKEYALPGGHVRIGETLEEGLVREYKEETGVDIRIRRMLWSEESFWKWGNRQVHGIAFYFLIEECGDFKIPDHGGFVPLRDNHNVQMGWIEMEELDHIIIYPKFLKTEIKDLNGPIRHFVSQ